MKKLLILSAGVFIIIFCSFGFQQNGIKKIGTNLYSVSRTSAKQISAEDKATLQRIIRQQYGIKNLDKTVAIAKDNPINKKGGCLVAGSFQTIIFDNRSVVMYNNNKELSTEAKQIQTIMAKYSR